VSAARLRMRWCPSTRWRGAQGSPRGPPAGAQTELKRHLAKYEVSLTNWLLQGGATPYKLWILIRHLHWRSLVVSAARLMSTHTRSQHARCCSGAGPRPSSRSDRVGESLRGPEEETARRE
jgi:hypothetical protein